MDFTSPAQARIACRTSDFSLGFETLMLGLVKRLFPPKPAFAAEDERTRHHVAARSNGWSDDARLHGSGESTAADGDSPG